MFNIFDPRTKVILLLLSPLLMGLSIGLGIEILVIFVYVIPFFISNELKWGIGFLLLFFLQLITAYYILPHLTSPFFLYTVSLLVTGFRRMMPSVIAGAFALKTTHISEWISMLKGWNMPTAVIVPFAVMARFFPTVREDYRQIRRAMAFRGIGIGSMGIVKNPIQSFEYILIPLLMNASQVAQDLTISALTKGLGMPGKHTSLVELKMRTLDYTYILIALIPITIHFGGQIL